MTFWLFARLFESPELYWSFDELCWNEAPLRRPFLKILYENTDKNKNKPDVEITKTYTLSNKIICKPPQSHETIPLKNAHFRPPEFWVPRFWETKSWHPRFEILGFETLDFETLGYETFGLETTSFKFLHFWLTLSDPRFQNLGFETLGFYILTHPMGP